MSADTTLYIFAGLWLLVLIAAVPLSRRYRHPDAKPTGAYFVFIIVFTVVAWAVLVMLLSFFSAIGAVESISGAVGAVFVVAVSFTLAFLAARHFIGKKPQQAPRLD